MADESPPPERAEEPPPRTPAGWALMAAGVILILWATLGLASAGYGSRPTRSFAERRSYNRVKTDVRHAFPFAVLRGLGGLVLLTAGARLRRR